MIYYEVKATYVKDAGDGKMKSTKEVYLVRALNYADAESRMVETLSHYSHEGMPEVEIKKAMNCKCPILWGYCNYSVGYLGNIDDYGNSFETSASDIPVGTTEKIVSEIVKLIKG